MSRWMHACECLCVRRDGVGGGGVEGGVGGGSEGGGHRQEMAFEVFRPATWSRLRTCKYIRDQHSDKIHLNPSDQCIDDKSPPKKEEEKDPIVYYLPWLCTSCCDLGQNNSNILPVECEMSVCVRNQMAHAWLGIKCRLSAGDSLCLTSSSLWLRNASL